ncbi:endoplasmic reticulum-Golgi intermediate compartment protein 1, partial [Trichinella spiralis]|uniref:endoplasmic reticulum-Golgi intermediate compartment protein 1 n=1 Tax=Trichinella spiralis TaxID=6334 RepID=UPI0001EFBAF4
LGLDIQDENGRHEVGFIENVVKHPVHAGGCRIEATFRISKYVSHLNFMYKTLLNSFDSDLIFGITQTGSWFTTTAIYLICDLHIWCSSCTIHTLNNENSTGQFSSFYSLRKNSTCIRRLTTCNSWCQEYNLPGNFNPLMNAEVLDSPVDNFPFSYDYILKIVPTVYENIAGNMKHAYQYTYARKTYIEMSFTGQTNPTLWFRYDFTPITVKYHERRQPLYIFLTSICAIIGGTFTVAGLIDSFFFTASQLYKKVELGKIKRKIELLTPVQLDRVNSRKMMNERYLAVDKRLLVNVNELVRSAMLRYLMRLRSSTVGRIDLRETHRHFSSAFAPF